MLYPALGSNRFCGPGALAALTGVTTDQAAAIIREITGARSVFGVDTGTMVKALLKLGYFSRQLVVRPYTSLARFAPELPEGRYLINVTGHYVAVARSANGTIVVDNQSVTERSLVEFRRANKHVKRAWQLIPKTQRPA